MVLKALGMVLLERCSESAFGVLLECSCSWNGALAVLLEWCSCSALGMVLLEWCSWSGALGIGMVLSDDSFGGTRE